MNINQWFNTSDFFIFKHGKDTVGFCYKSLYNMGRYE